MQADNRFVNNKIHKAFENNNGKAFIAFLTAGDPDADSTVKFVLEMEKASRISSRLAFPSQIPRQRAW